MVSLNDLRFDEQVAVITGAGGGLGKQYALLLASRGARVVVNDTGGSVTGTGADTDAANAVAEEIRRQGGEAVADTNSVTSPQGGQARGGKLMRLRHVDLLDLEPPLPAPLPSPGPAAWSSLAG